MNRLALIETLDLVGRGLAGNNLIQIFQHFCFKDGRVFAYNGEIGVEAPCGVEGTFALHGETLLKLLKATQAEDVTITVKDEAVITSGRSKLKMPYLTEDAFIFEPTDGWKSEVALKSPLLEGLSECLLTSSRNQALEALMGVRVCLNDFEIDLYSCDDDSITKYSFQHAPLGASAQYMLSNAFCETLIRMPNATSGRLMFGPEWAVAALADGWRVFGRMKPINTGLDYEDLIKKTIKGEPEFITAPPELKEALARAVALTDKNSAMTEITIKDSQACLVTQTSLGTVDDEFYWPGADDVTARVNSALLARALTVCKEISIQENCTLARGENTLVLSANAG